MFTRRKKYVKCQASGSTITDSIENQSLPTLPIKARVKWGAMANAHKIQGKSEDATTRTIGAGNLSEEASPRINTIKQLEQTNQLNLQDYVYLAAQDTESHKIDAQEYRRLELVRSACNNIFSDPRSQQRLYSTSYNS